MKKIVKGILAATGIVLVSSGIMLAANTNNKGEVKDVNPPFARLSIRGATSVNSVNYVDKTSITVDIFAVDDYSSNEDIKYYLSMNPISDAEKLEESKWKSYKEGAFETFTLPSLSSTNTVYAAFKDKAGNTSIIYVGEDNGTGNNLEYTVTYHANGGNGAPATQTNMHGMSMYLTNELPTYEGKYFLGWSSGENATKAEYIQGDYLPATMFEGEQKNLDLYAVWTDNISELPLLANRVKVGDYVNYPVYYENVPTINGSYTSNLTGWRVLSIEDDGTVNLVSAGVPLTYYFAGNAATGIKSLAVNFLENLVTTNENYAFRKNGFNPYQSLEEIFDNKFTGVFKDGDIVSYTSTYYNGTVVTYSGEKEAGDLKVRAMTKEDLDKVYDKTGKTVAAYGTNVTNAKYEKLLAIPCSDKTSNYAHYWLASANGSTNLWLVNGYYGNVNSYNNTSYGVRPVVSLKSTVKTTGIDMIGAYNIEVE